MRQFLEIVTSSFRLAMIELWKNKLRTFLSLFGVTIGIFCIIGVLATVNSLQTNIQTQLQALGNNTLYIDKWEWAGGPDYPWWKYITRPEPKIQEVEQIKERTRTAAHTAFFVSQTTEVELGDNV
ncbi:MAG: ABC transporter permease, partial [Chitinophagaceae bacterium]